MKLNLLLVITVGIFSLSIYSQSKIKDGTVTGSSPAPVSNAILELESNNKGFLATRISLASNTDIVTIPSPTVGLLAFNTGNAGLKYKGYVYWSGTDWVTLSGETLFPASVLNFDCANASIYPKNYTAGVPYVGSMSIPYHGGNGGLIVPDTIVANGITAILPQDRISRGDGYLVYNLTGTPIASSPSSFSVTLGSITCTAVIGSNAVEQGQLVYYKGSMPAAPANVWMSDYISDLPLIGGKLRLDGFFRYNSNATSNTSFNPRLVNVTTSPVKIWFGALTTVDQFNESNLIIAPGGYTDLDNYCYLGYGNNMKLGISTPVSSHAVSSHTRQEVVILDLVLDDHWYKVYYFPLIDNKDAATDVTNERVIFLSIQRLY